MGLGVRATKPTKNEAKIMLPHSVYTALLCHVRDKVDERDLVQALFDKVPDDGLLQLVADAAGREVRRELVVHGEHNVAVNAILMVAVSEIICTCSPCSQGLKHNTEFMPTFWRDVHKREREREREKEGGRERKGARARESEEEERGREREREGEREE